MAACIDTRLWQGQPCVHLGLPNGDQAVISLHGAQVVSWVAAGRERLYLSPRATWDGHAPIRGGIPVCFPQFNQRGPVPGLPKHGFARQRPWTLGPTVCEAGSARVSLVLRVGEAQAAVSLPPCEATLVVTLAPGSLRVELGVVHTGHANASPAQTVAETLAFTGALHTYLAVDAIAHARLHGLGGQPEWNALTDAHGAAPPTLRIAGEFDRVYTASTQPLQLDDGAGCMRIAQGGFGQTVVWNPGPALCARLPDLPPDGFDHLLCVEAACVDAPVRLAPGEAWHGWQHLSVV